MKNLKSHINEALSSKDESILKKYGFVKYTEGAETWFEHKKNKAEILQEEPGDNSFWNVRINHIYLENSDGEWLAFESPLEAAEEIIGIVNK